MASDLKAMTIKELSKLKKEVIKALAAAEDRGRREALKAAEKAAAKFGYSLVELSGNAKPKPARKSPKAKPKAKAKAKYRNPADASQTWSGRGRRPLWINEAMSSGADISKFEI